jgi:hypothetical protein
MGEAKRRKLAGEYRSTGHHTIPHYTVPDDLKADIATAVRAIPLISPVSSAEGGHCFIRTLLGHVLMTKLGLDCQIALGGLIYRVGPDPARDVVAFCGPGNAGAIVNGVFVGHMWLEFQDHFIDFSVGDWRGIDLSKLEREAGLQDMGEVQWEITPPEFFWVPKREVMPVPGQQTPDLGKAWYTGFRGDQLPKPESIREIIDDPEMHRNFARLSEHFALKERAWAAQNGHTAIRYSGVLKMLGLPAPTDGDRCIVLRGQGELTPELARELVREVEGETL